ncbi:MAG: HAMP domain-containing histidine kinase [Bacteroidales bacterium]|nr:HAMP domain-containing histidine kinase [Bacteroidales bacterium]
MKPYRLKYRQQIFLWFFIAFACFTTGIVLFQQRWERNIKTENLKNNLNGYAAIIHRYIQEQHLTLDAETPEQMTDILNLLPSNLRITIIDQNGELLFDNQLSDIENVENHLKRAEIRQALKDGNGSDIRLSHSMNMEFFYLAHAYDHYYIRVALPYNIETKNIIRPDNWFLYFTSILFLTVLILLIYISGRLGKAITGLRNFIFSINSENDSEAADIHFPDTEFGEIAGQIVANYQQLKQTKNQLALEKEKLDLCFQNSDEGVGVFSESLEPVFVNTRFITFVNTILDNHNAISKALFDTEEFSNVKHFLDNNNSQSGISFPVGKIAKNGKHFSLKCIIFHDNSFQIILTDITQSETTRLLKQEMTNNIAHELRTPVSSIRGYLETMLEQENLDIQKQRSFLERSYQQTLKLSELIRDIALITKIEEAPHLFLEETVNISSVLQELKEEFEIPFHANDIAFEDNISPEIAVTGNRTLIYAIFRNLIENVVTYAGKGVAISIDIYNESAVRYFFSFSDTGKGVAEEHLSKMFDRFYRLDEGRTRDSGGSGLGLAIVKNAVQFHQGDIIAKNRKDGGLEFLFTLKKLSEPQT